jgi:hypothetical protein
MIMIKKVGSGLYHSSSTILSEPTRHQRINGSGRLKADLEVGVEDVLLRLPFLQLLQRRLAVHPAHHTYGTVPISFQFLSHRVVAFFWVNSGCLL